MRARTGPVRLAALCLLAVAAPPLLGATLEGFTAYRKGNRVYFEARLSEPPTEPLQLRVVVLPQRRAWLDAYLPMKPSPKAPALMVAGGSARQELEIRAGDQLEVTLLLGKTQMPVAQVTVRDESAAVKGEPAAPVTAAALTSPTPVPTTSPAVVASPVPAATLPPPAATPVPTASLVLPTVAALPSRATTARDPEPTPVRPGPASPTPNPVAEPSSLSAASQVPATGRPEPPAGTPGESPASAGDTTASPGPPTVSPVAAGVLVGFAVALLLVAVEVLRRRSARGTRPRVRILEEESTDRRAIRVPTAGDTIAEADLKVVGTIAHGGLCDIVMARHRGAADAFALKILRPEFQTSPRLSAALAHEGDIIGYLNERHPEEIVVTLKGRGTLRDRGTDHPYLLLEYVDGIDLKSYVRSKGALEESECLEVVYEVGRALVAIHSDGFVHGDISPENILRLRDGAESPGAHPPGGRRLYRLIDFGDAHRHEEGARAPEIAGKPAFLSPEQARGFLGSPASDVYGLGMVLFFLRAGRPAFESPNALDLLRMHERSEIVFPESFSLELRRLIGRMCWKLPSGRIPAARVVELVNEVRNGAPSRA